MHYATIETRDPPIETDDAKAIEVTGPDYAHEPVCAPPEEVQLLNVEVVVETWLGVREDSGTYDPLEVSLADYD